MFFFWDGRRKLQDLVFYFLKIVHPFQAVVIDTSQVKKSPAHRSPLAVRTVHPAQDIRYFRILPAHVNDLVHRILWHIRGKDQFLPVLHKRTIFRHKGQFITASRKQIKKSMKRGQIKLQFLLLNILTKRKMSDIIMSNIRLSVIVRK